MFFNEPTNGRHDLEVQHRRRSFVVAERGGSFSVLTSIASMQNSGRASDIRHGVEQRLKRAVF